MARDRFPGDRHKFPTRERLTSDNLQESIELAEMDSRRFSGNYVRFADGYYGYIEMGCKVVEDSPTAMTLRVGNGYGRIWSATELDGIDNTVFDENYHGYHSFTVGGSANQEVTISANSSGNPRIDLVVLELVVADAEGENVDIFNTTTRVFDSTPSTPKRIRKDLTVANGGISVITGTPGASPAEPSFGNYQIPLAAVYVANGTTTLANAVIFDRRIPMNPKKFFGRFTSSGAKSTHAFYGTNRTIEARSGGFIGESFDVTFDSQPGTGRYLFDLTGFKVDASGYPLISVNVCPIFNAPTIFSWFVSGANQLELYFETNAGTAVDRIFELTVEEIGSLAP